MTRFQVANAFEISGRGSVVYGDVIEGVVRIGMHIAKPQFGKPLTVSAVEFLDNLTVRRDAVALMFEERPDVAELQANFPKGAILILEET
jgi:hypothetical protein